MHAVAPGAFLVSQHDERFGRRDLRQPRGLHGLGRSGQQQRGDQRAVGDGRVDQAAAQFLHHHHGLDGAEAQATVRLRHGQAGEAEFGEFGVDGTRAATGLGDAVAALEGKALLDPAAHRVAQRDLVVGEIEVHVQLPRTVCATMLRWTSLLPP